MVKRMSGSDCIPSENHYVRMHTSITEKEIEDVFSMFTDMDDDSYGKREQSFQETYYDTANFDLLQNDTFLIKRVDCYTGDETWMVTTNYEKRSNGIIAYTIRSTRDRNDLNLLFTELKQSVTFEDCSDPFLALSVCRYHMVENREEWVDTVSKFDNETGLFYAVRTSVNHSEGSPSAPPVLAFLYRDENLREKMSPAFLEIAKQSQNTFYQTKVSDRLAELWQSTIII